MTPGWQRLTHELRLGLRERPIRVPARVPLAHQRQAEVLIRLAQQPAPPDGRPPLKVKHGIAFPLRIWSADGTWPDAFLSARPQLGVQQSAYIHCTTCLRSASKCAVKFAFWTTNAIGVSNTGQ